MRSGGRAAWEVGARLHLAAPVDLIELKARWLDALDRAEAFIRSRPPEELGCLYYSVSDKRFVAPAPES